MAEATEGGDGLTCPFAPQPSPPVSLSLSRGQGWPHLNKERWRRRRRKVGWGELLTEAAEAPPPHSLSLQSPRGQGGRGGLSGAEQGPRFLVCKAAEETEAGGALGYGGSSRSSADARPSSGSLGAPGSSLPRFPLHPIRWLARQRLGKLWRASRCHGWRGCPARGGGGGEPIGSAAAAGGAGTVSNKPGMTQSSHFKWGKRLLHPFDSFAPWNEIYLPLIASHPERLRAVIPRR